MTSTGISTAVLDAARPLTMRAAFVLVVDGLDRGARASVPEVGLRIGTAPSCSLALRDPTVSRIHCDLELRRDGVRLLDAGSTNGTFVEGARVRDADLFPGATFRMGATTLRLLAGDEPVNVPLSSRSRLCGLVGESVEMRRVYAIVERVAPTDTTVLVQGDTGTGKELVARAIHDLSRRAAGPFVAVDCGAIAPTVIESELFGHVRGAFSGAVGDRKGLFEEADGGTLFLDEVGELPLALQAKLLRALETREVRRVGGNATKRVNVRVVAATNRPLARSVNDGTFREELYYRLGVVEIRLAPLHARREDIPLLAAHFYRAFAGPDAAPPADLLSALLTRSWPGNVRELRNFIERALSLGWETRAREGAPLAPGIVAGLDALVPVELPLKEARDAWMAQFESAYVRATLRRAHGNVTHAAEAAGISRRFLQRIMVRIGLRDGASSLEADDGDR